MFLPISIETIMKIVTVSRPATVIEGTLNPDPIHVFTQFFIHSDHQRQRELRFCLKQVALHPDVHQLHLLGERIYTDDELGVQTDKIVQMDIGRRLRFQDVFEYIRRHTIQGYYILINSDICFDPASLVNLRTTDIHLERKLFAQLRFEYNAKNPAQSPIFGPRADSQDAWIYHSNFPIPEHAERAFEFEFGKPGCDNKMIYLAQILGYEVINDPLFIRTYHVHADRKRGYTLRDEVHSPWGMIIPARTIPSTMPSYLGIDYKHVHVTTRGFKTIQFNDNQRLIDYVTEKVDKGEPFILPQIVGIETVAAVLERTTTPGKNMGDLMDYISSQGMEVAAKSGIRLTSVVDMREFSAAYYKAFDQCDLFGAWDIQGPQCIQIAQSHEHVKYLYSSKTPIWAATMDVFHYLYSTPWTMALRGKRILIVSPWTISADRIDNRSTIWNGIDILPDCEITSVTVDMKALSRRPFVNAMNELVTMVDEKNDTYDVALIACGGFSNPLCWYLYRCGKSAVHVGDVLALWFGIATPRWIAERPDIIRMYSNSAWTSQSANDTK